MCSTAALKKLKKQMPFKVAPRVVQARAADPGKHQPVSSPTDVLAAAAAVFG